MAGATKSAATRSRRPAPPVTGDVLDYDDVMAKFDGMMEWLARTYVHAMNCIHYMHDKYFYERLEMALHDRDILRTMAFGIAGLSVVADSLSAIKYAKVQADPATRPASSSTTRSTGDFPTFGNNDDRVDASRPTSSRASWRSCASIRPIAMPMHTQSVLTITSNVVYGKAHRQHAGRPPQGRALRARRQPDARPRQPWLARLVPVGRQAALRAMRRTASATRSRSRRRRRT